MSEIIGNIYILKNCKHHWNNGVKVKITGIEEEIDCDYEDNSISYNAIDIKNSNNRFIVGINNLKKDN